jgi:hypothetical protein
LVLENIIRNSFNARSDGTWKCKRPLIVVPNDSILKQWVETIFETIPNAKVNVLGNLGKIMTSQNLIIRTEKLPSLLMKALIILVF